MAQVDEIKQRIDIVDLISQHVTLKRAGRNYMALCPFHTEKTPSFHVDPSRQSWHCFGACATGGDIFSFIMKKNACDFREALRVLGEQAGVATATRRDTQEDSRRTRIFEINETAAAFFQASLDADDASSAGAAAARAYIAERQLAPESVERFQLGYAPNSWEALVTHLEMRGFTGEEAVGAGLAVSGDRGAYDRFRHRLMFPIRDERGRVAGFGGRLLPGVPLGAGESPAKYVNTSQSAAFDKSSILYALDVAKDAIRSEGRVVIVEGYMDVIAAHEYGYTNVVASMGTALTERQVAVLRRHTNGVVLALDEDEAGIEATLRSVYEIVNSNLTTRPVPNSRGVVRQEVAPALDVRVLVKPAGKDPDEFIRVDPEGWGTLVDNAVPLLDYVFAAAAGRHDAATPAGRSEMAQILIPWLSLTTDRIVQANYLQRLARMVQVDEATLRLEMRAPAMKITNDPARERVPTALQRTRDKREEFCLALLVRYPELRAEGTELEPSLFGHSDNRALFESWIGWADNGEPFEATIAQDLQPQLARINTLEVPQYDDEALIKALRSTVWGIEQQRLRFAKRASAAVLADMATDDDSALIAERARSVWETGGAHDVPGDEADPAQAFVDDMEAGLKIHQRVLDQRRVSAAPHDEVAH